MEFYINGLEDLSSEDSLILKLFNLSPKMPIKIALSYIGNNLETIKGRENQEDIVKRLKTLIDYFLTQFKTGGIEIDKDDLSFFTIWFKKTHVP